jgi:hypothetical protein
MFWFVVCHVPIYPPVYVGGELIHDVHLLYHRFGDNFGLFEDERGRFWVVWVTDVQCDTDHPGLDDDITVVGHRFMKMKTSGATDRPKTSKNSVGYCMSNFHSYIVWDLDVENTVAFRKDQLVGKGSCLYLRQDLDPGRTKEGDYKKPRSGTTWLFELLDHCIDYSALECTRRASPLRPTRRKRKRQSVPDDAYLTDDE